MENLRYLILSVVIALIGYGAWIGFQDIDQFRHAIHQIGWPGFFFVCMLSMANYLLRYLRWFWYTRLLQDTVGFGDGLMCFLAGFALTTTPGKAGEAIRCLYFKQRHQVEHTHTLAALVSERLTDAIAIAMIAIFALFHFEQFRLMGYVLSGLIVIALSMIHRPGPMLRIAAWVANLHIPLISRLAAALPLFVERCSTLMSLKAIGIGTLIGLVSWSAEAYGFAWLTGHFVSDISVPLIGGIFAIAMLTGSLILLPGGLGGTEAVMYLLLVSTGVPETAALTITLLCRLATLWFAVVVGLLAMLWIEKVEYKP